MDASKPLELVPMGTPEGGSAPTPVEPTPEEAALDVIEMVPFERPIPIVGSGAAKKIDPYVQQAARDYAEGHVDQALWVRCLVQANGDKTAAAAIYVRARGTALKLLDRERGAEPLRIVPRPASSLGKAKPSILDDDDGWVPPPEPKSWTRYRYAIIAAALLIPLGIGAWFFTSDTAETASPTLVAAPTRTPVKKAPVAAVPASASQAAKAEPIAPSGTDFKQKVQDLRDVGNWNVLVLYAVEWTRKEPSNPAAWDRLREGYLYLRQYEDALNAATKTTQLSPNEARMWRQLGEVNLDIDDPPAALAAFEQASARNPHDTRTLQRIGLLHARLGRQQEAKVAFDRALAVTPNDATTHCLRTGVTQMTPAGNAYAVARQISAIDERCRGRGEVVAAPGK